MDALFDGWRGVAEIALTAVLGYGAVVLLLRASGKRTLSQLNLFDFVVTVALGSALSATILTDSVSLLEGVTAIAVLTALQAGVAAAAARSARFARVVKSEPALLLRDGELLREAMRRNRVSEREVLQALRSSGVADRQHAAAVVLETNGDLSVITEAGGGVPTVEPARD